MGYLFRDERPVLSAGTQVEVLNGASAPTLVKIPLFEIITLNNIGTATAVNQVLWTAPSNPSVASGALGLGENYQLLEVAVRFSTGSTSGTLQIEATPSGTAVGSGTNLLASALALSGTANTTTYAYPSGSVSQSNMVINNGESLSAIFGGTLTSLAGCTITVMIGRF